MANEEIPKMSIKMYGYDQIIFFEFRILRILTKKRHFLGDFFQWKFRDIVT